MDMKKGIVVFTLLCAASAVVGALAGSFVVEKRLSEQSAQYAERSLEQPQTATAQFAAYTPENYPDLTFAAETAVRAVVNIEAITEIDVASMNHFNPFFEFFGFPQGPQQQGAPQKREQRSGGSGVII
jgi:S1-C subfamily serine protease